MKQTIMIEADIVKPLGEITLQIFDHVAQDFRNENGVGLKVTRRIPLQCVEQTFERGALLDPIRSLNDSIPISTASLCERVGRM